MRAQVFPMSLMQEVLVRAMAKGAVKTGVRLAVVAGFYATVATMSTAYRNKVCFAQESKLVPMLVSLVIPRLYVLILVWDISLVIFNWIFWILQCLV